MAQSSDRRAAKRGAAQPAAASAAKPDLALLESLRGSAEEAATLLRAIGSSHRLMILCALADAPMTVTDICEAIDARQSLVSQHLIRLRQDRLVSAERRGHFVHYSLSHEAAREIVAVLQRHFCPDISRRKRSQ